MKRAALALALLASFSVQGCTPDLTQIMVVVDSDLDVPGQIDTVRIDITGPEGDPKTATALLAGDRGMDLPRTLGIVHRGGPLGTVRVFVEGRLGGAAVIQRHAELDFVPGKVVVLRMDLLSACLGKMCAADETCGDNGACIDRFVDSSNLGEWTGDPGHLDGGMPDAADGGMADGCIPAEEICNEADDDCDGMADEGFDLQSDPTHCGACDTVCDSNPLNAAATCQAGDCILQCDPGWADCDGMDETGCEALLIEPDTCGDCSTVCSESAPYCFEGTTAADSTCVADCGTMTVCGGSCVSLETSAQHCGSCGNRCPSRPNALPSCEAAACTFVCDTGWHDCDGVADNGCESQLRSLVNCGACGASCDLANASESCATGTCQIVDCNDGFGDCNMVASDGCETTLANDPMSCGACGTVCPPDPVNGSSICSSGSCQIVCDTGFADCDEDPSNGCESSLSSAATCGSCGIRCTGAESVCQSSGGSYMCVAGCGSGLRDCAGACVDTGTDPSNCGICGNACPDRPNSSPTCTSGVCGFSCDAGWGDCDGDPSNGCEQSLTSLAHCGSCGGLCALEHATESCSTGTCLISSCESGFADCDGVAPNGCETPLTTTSNCGSCGNECPSMATNASGSECLGGTCVLVCDDGFGDCDRNLANGCEQNLTMPRHCGGCGNNCGAGLCCDGICCSHGQSCVGGVCGPV